MCIDLANQCRALKSLWHQYEGEVWYFPILKLLCEIFFSFLKSVQKNRSDWKQLLAANWLTKKYGRLVYVCFIKHLFLVLFLAALAAGCQQGSWFLVLSVDITPLESHTHTHMHTHIHTHRMDNTWPNKPFTLESNLISQGSWYLFEKSPFLAFLQYDIQCM